MRNIKVVKIMKSVLLGLSEFWLTLPGMVSGVCCSNTTVMTAHGSSVQLVTSKLNIQEQLSSNLHWHNMG